MLLSFAQECRLESLIEFKWVFLFITLTLSHPRSNYIIYNYVIIELPRNVKVKLIHIQLGFKVELFFQLYNWSFLLYLSRRECRCGTRC